jgi:hypothetical protein
MQRIEAAAISRSRLLPHATGVIASRDLRKRSRIFCEGVATIDLIRMRRRHLTLLEFVALRQQWASDQFFTYMFRDVEGTEYRLAYPAAIAGDLPTDEVKTAPEDAFRREYPHVLCLPAEGLFHINDAFPWELPPPNDLASPAYWKGFRARMAEYERFAEGDCCNVDLLVGMNKAIIAGGDDGTDITSITARQQPSKTTLVKLVTQRPIAEGDELLLHYGKEWWTTTLLRTLFMAASDAQLKDIRWIESLFASPEHRHVPFPWIVGRPASDGGKPVLMDLATQARATDSAALAFCFRRSCQRESFLARIMSEVFNGPDTLALVPIRELRRCLLRDLMEEPSEPSLAA